eukprot:m.165493 g.165493  ORF g.165493 m.165493 type:complete len:61 (+) comp16595_c1_seq3:53-235(+)
MVPNELLFNKTLTDCELDTLGQHRPSRGVAVTEEPAEHGSVQAGPLHVVQLFQAISPTTG